MNAESAEVRSAIDLSPHSPRLTAGAGAATGASPGRAAMLHRDADVELAERERVEDRGRLDVADTRDVAGANCVTGCALIRQAARPRP